MSVVRPPDLTPTLQISTGIGAAPVEQVQAARARVLAEAERRGDSAILEIAKYLDLPPVFGRWFDKGRQITLAASASRTEVVAFRVQNGMYAVLRFFANATQNASDSPSVTFALLLDGTPIAGYANIIGPKSPALTSPDPVVVPLFPGNRVSVVATNAAAVAITGVGARIKGWFWPGVLRRG